jgi:GR25 family glycosyltransferase involved in LPS biosynthesis
MCVFVFFDCDCRITKTLYDAIYVINLDRSPDRLKKIQKQFEAMGMKFKRFKAVDGSKIEILNVKTREVLKGDAVKTFVRGKKFENNMEYRISYGDYSIKYKTDAKILKRYLSYGELGCALSHLNIMIDIVKNNFKNAIVFEDDVVFEKTFPTDLAAVLAHAPSDYDILFLDVGMCGSSNASSKCSMFIANPDRVLRNFRQIPENKYLVKVLQGNILYGLHAYCISQKGAKKVLESIDNAHLTWPIDNHIFDLGRTVGADMNYFVARKKMLFISDDPSLIHEMGRNFAAKTNGFIGKRK